MKHLAMVVLGCGTLVFLALIIGVNAAVLVVFPGFLALVSLLFLSMVSAWGWEGLKKVAPTFSSLDGKASSSGPRGEAMANLCMQVAWSARREGLAQLDTTKLEDVPLLSLAVRWLVDGMELAAVKDLLWRHRQSQKDSLEKLLKMVSALETSAPSLAIACSVIYLVGALMNLTDSSKLISLTSAALLVTLYGIFLASAVFAPLASRVEAKLSGQDMDLEMVLATCETLSGAGSPNHLKERMESLTGVAIKDQR